MLTLEKINKTYQTDKIETIALKDINLNVKRGEFISIMGPSGCGKSTLLNIMGLLDAPTEGDVKVAGQSIESYKDKHVAEPNGTGEKHERRRLANEALERVGLKNRTHHFPSQLSGGQQQRVAIARAIVGKPELLLADEPTGNLDSHMGNEIMQILESLNKDDGTSIVMVTHDEEQAKRTERIVRVYDGQLVH